MSGDEKDPLQVTSPVDDNTNIVEDGFIDDDDEEKDKVVLSQDTTIGMSEDRTTRMTFPLPETRYKRTFPMRETTIGPLKFNYLVSFIGFFVLWGISIYCIVVGEPAGAVLRRWYDTTILYFTWFYIAGNPVMTFFIFWVAYRYGHIKLGPKDKEPEFSNVSYFAMLFSAGIGVGLFFFGISEPLWHQSGNYFTARGYHSQNEIDQWWVSLDITVFSTL